MSAEFSANISALRREKGISQKDAAEALGVSQALLSHYEKGIRECSLDFVKKAAEYYDVSSDYLLGLSKMKHATGELISLEELTTDSSVSPKTLLRCILYLSSVAEKTGDYARIYFDDYFSLCVKRYISALRADEKEPIRLLAMITDILTDENKKQLSKATDLSDAPLTLKTVEQHCAMLISKQLSEML